MALHLSNGYIVPLAICSRTTNTIVAVPPPCSPKHGKYLGTNDLCKRTWHSFLAFGALQSPCAANELEY